MLSGADHAVLRGVEAYVRAARRGWGPRAVPIEGGVSLSPGEAALRLAPLAAQAGLYGPRLAMRLLIAIEALRDLLDMQGPKDGS